MLSEKASLKINEIWDNYLKNNRVVIDSKGVVYSDIDSNRLDAIKDIKKLVILFLDNKITVFEFKRQLDSYNKRHNLWGFTATKGQMFFNQLLKFNEIDIERINIILKQTITEPKNLVEALEKIELLEEYVLKIYLKSKDKRKTPNPGSVGYFLSYFWQIFNHDRWPVIYTSLINSFKELGIWKDHSSQRESYEFFFNLNNLIKENLRVYTNKNISNWDAEHAFWGFTGKPTVIYNKTKDSLDVNLDLFKEIKIKANFDVNDYLIPKVSKLVQLGDEVGKSSSSKGAEFEKLVAEIFKQLDFEVDFLGQGSGRNPDAIIKFREENTAFLLDAKAYSNGYSLGTDDRAIKEYISHYCPKLLKEGYKKIGFIIVSNSFKSSFVEFSNDITWNTDVKRLILLESEALLYLLAFKTKEKLSVSQIVECLIGSDTIITSDIVSDAYEDI